MVPISFGPRRANISSPERAIQIQFDLEDMMVCLDDPRPNDASDEEIVKAEIERPLGQALSMNSIDKPSAV
jgi:hypothetical protein